MIAQRYYSDNIPIPLKEVVYAYNSSCPSFCTYDNYRSMPYLITSTILLEVLLKKILLVVNGDIVEFMYLFTLYNLFLLTAYI